MLLDYKDGRKRAERLREGDLLWSRDESNPDGPLVLKRVEAVFVRVGPVKEVRLAGQVIRTTAEHRFFVAGKGWTPACALEPGDELTTREGLRLAVEGLADGGVETLYNGRIADCHTYFVSADHWSVSVWRTTRRRAWTAAGPRVPRLWPSKMHRRRWTTRTLFFLRKIGNFTARRQVSRSGMTGKLTTQIRRPRLIERRSERNPAKWWITILPSSSGTMTAIRQSKNLLGD